MFPSSPLENRPVVFANVFVKPRPLRDPLPIPNRSDIPCLVAVLALYIVVTCTNQKPTTKPTTQRLETIRAKLVSRTDPDSRSPPAHVQQAPPDRTKLDKTPSRRRAETELN